MIMNYDVDDLICSRNVSQLIFGYNYSTIAAITISKTG